MVDVHLSQKMPEIRLLHVGIDSTTKEKSIATSQRELAAKHLFALQVSLGMMQLGRMGYVPAYGGNGNSRNVSCSKPSLHCHKRPWEGALYKIVKSASDARHMALYK